MATESFKLPLRAYEDGTHSLDPSEGSEDESDDSLAYYYYLSDRYNCPSPPYSYWKQDPYEIPQSEHPSEHYSEDPEDPDFIELSDSYIERNDPARQEYLEKQWEEELIRAHIAESELEEEREKAFIMEYEQWKQEQIKWKLLLPILDRLEAEYALEKESETSIKLRKSVPGVRFGDDESPKIHRTQIKKRNPYTKLKKMTRQKKDRGLRRLIRLVDIPPPITDNKSTDDESSHGMPGSQEEH